MNSPKNPEAPGPHVSFEALYTEAFTRHAAVKQTAEHALSIGLRPDDLLHYVRGELKSYALIEVHHSLSRSPWAQGRVVALVKAARDPKSLGSKLLSSTHTDPYAWGMRDSGDRDLDMAHLLERV